MTKTTKTLLVAQTLKDMAIEDLKSIAKALNVPVGKSKTQTTANVAKAINTKGAEFTAHVIIRTPATAPTDPRKVLYHYKYRTHKEDKALFPTLPVKS